MGLSLDPVIHAIGFEDDLIIGAMGGMQLSPEVSTTQPFISTESILL